MKLYKASALVKHVGLMSLLVLLLAACSLNEAPDQASKITPTATNLPRPSFSTSADTYGSVAAFSCYPSLRTGTKAFGDLLIAATTTVNHYGGWRACNAPFGAKRSQHKTGRAVDVPLDSRKSAQRADGMAILEWLFEAENGVPHARLRRLGVVQIIWDGRVWTTAHDKGRKNHDPTNWRKYTGLGCKQNPRTQPTVCHYDHFHFTLSAAGSEKQTTWWTDPTNPTCTRKWPLVQRSSGFSTRAKAVQYLLKARGYSLTVDGYFRPSTQAVVERFQRDHGLADDSKVGKNTFEKLVTTVSYGSKGDAVKAAQVLLKFTGGDVDGDFGPATDRAIRSFQASKGLVQDGDVGANTWAALFGGAGCR